MSRRSLGTLIAGLALVLAACSSSGSSPPPRPRPHRPSAPSAATSAAAGTCSETKDAGAVAVSIKDFEFDPATITAKVGQIVAFSNTGAEPHNATLDAGGCATATLQTSQADGLVFTAAGTYPFHCTVHTQMKGTITVS